MFLKRRERESVLKNLSYIANEINKGKDLDENLLLYLSYDIIFSDGEEGQCNKLIKDVYL